MEESKRGICVNIFGSDYVIKGEGDPQYIREVAAFVDSKMKEIASTTSNVSSIKVSILTALNLADELFKIKKENSLSQKSLGRVDDLIKIFDGQDLKI
jgi:cell division protein ZapA